jgi:TRAP-type mannitol/chloroaromatic compound transport system permease small subunit
MTRPVLDRLDMVNEWVGRVMSFMVLILIAIVIYEVTMRYGFDSPTRWAHEMTGLLQMTLIMLAGGYTLRHNAHVKIDLIYARLSPKKQAFLDLTINSVLFFSFISILLYYGSVIALKSIAVREVSSVGLWRGPIYPFKVVIPIGGCLITFQWIINMVRNVRILKDRGEVVDTTIDYQTDHAL